MKKRRTLDHDGLDGVLPSAGSAKPKAIWFQSPWFLMILCSLLIILFFAQKQSEMPLALTAEHPPQAGIVSAKTDLATEAENLHPAGVESASESAAKPTNATPLVESGDVQMPKAQPDPEPVVSEQVKSPSAAAFTVYFELASSKLNLLPEAEIGNVVSAAKSCSSRIKLIGHTCNLGTAAGNQKLGLARAKAVENLLVAQDIKRQRIVTESKGMRQPAAPNDTQAGQALNRRTELSCLDQ